MPVDRTLLVARQAENGVLASEARSYHHRPSGDIAAARLRQR